MRLNRDLKLDFATGVFFKNAPKLAFLKGNRGCFLLKREAYVHFLRKHRYLSNFLYKAFLGLKTGSPPPGTWEKVWTQLKRCTTGSDATQVASSLRGSYPF